jgi:O-antigen/teichoic acid export membrane protein
MTQPASRHSARRRSLAMCLGALRRQISSPSSVSLKRHRVMSDAAWSLFGVVGSALSGLLVVRLSSALIAPAEYGRASLALGAIALLGIVIIVPAMATLQRLNFDYLHRDLGGWFAGRAWRMAGAIGLVGAAAYLLMAAGYALVGGRNLLDLCIPAVIAIAIQPLYALRTGFLEAHRRQRALAMATIVLKLLHPVVLVALLAFAIPPAASVIVAPALAMVVLTATLRTPGRQFAETSPPSGALPNGAYLHRQMLSMGWWLPLTNVATWMLTTADRYIVQHYIGVTAVGVYVMNYSLWSLPYILLNGWLELVTRPIVYAAAAQHDWTRIRQTILARIAVGAGCSVIGTAILLHLRSPIAASLLGSLYSTSYAFTLCIALAHCLMVVGYSAVPIFLASKQAGLLVRSSWLAAFGLIACEILLVPQIGIMGAALATLGSYALWSALVVRTAFSHLNRLASERAAPRTETWSSDIAFRTAI